MAKRILLLCFIHGFKGDDDTFRDFPKHLKDTVTSNLLDHHVASVVYPKYETKGELTQTTEAFLEWLKERVMELRKEHLQAPWPPTDRNVGVILVAHSMGGFVASDTLFRILDERRRNAESENPTGPIFPMIQGILAFDTPYNGLARSMFVYGAFSNYQKVSNVFNVMTALSAAAPATLASLASKRTAVAATKAVSGSISVPRRSHPALKAWQLIAVRTGTVGVIAAGGVAAYMHRKEILEGMRTVKNLKKEDVVQGYQQSVDALGQGLAYINRGNVGQSFAWLSDHFTFVGALLKQNELNRRLERLAAVKGVGIKDIYASLGENGYWSGGYFVPERTFCAIPGEGQPCNGLFSRHVVADAKDELEAHVNLFKPEKNKGYERMTNEAAQLVLTWFKDETDIWDDPKFAEPAEPETAETEEIAKAIDEADQEAKTAEEKVKEAEKKVGGEVDEDDSDGDGVPDESPIDIAAAASLVPLPDDLENAEDDDGTADPDKKKAISEQKQAYMRHLFGVAQQTGTNIRSYLPTKLPEMPEWEMPKVFMPSVSMPSMPGIPNIPSIGKYSLWGSKKSDTSQSSETEAKPDTSADKTEVTDAKSEMEKPGADTATDKISGEDKISAPKAETADASGGA
ncbi:hypothetical protein QBC45DRAFT_398380 [Copromyces sp. CBS 386.78]|nr:hypothetical protein QBC45DRAFT_398380 [Copromyces sp. CBS 386.78]